MNKLLVVLIAFAGILLITTLILMFYCLRKYKASKNNFNFQSKDCRKNVFKKCIIYSLVALAMLWLIVFSAVAIVYSSHYYTLIAAIGLFLIFEIVLVLSFMLFENK